MGYPLLMAVGHVITSGRMLLDIMMEVAMVAHVISVLHQHHLRSMLMPIIIVNQGLTAFRLLEVRITSPTHCGMGWDVPLIITVAQLNTSLGSIVTWVPALQMTLKQGYVFPIQHMQVEL